MIYAQLHTYTYTYNGNGNGNGTQVTVASRTDQPDTTWIPYDVPSADWLYLLNGVVTVHTQAEMDAAALPGIQTTQLALIETSYQNAMSLPIAYMGTIFQAGVYSQSLIANVLTASGGSLPTGFTWFDINNVPVTMTFAQLQGLAGTILMRGQPLFVRKQLLKSNIRSATTITKVESITW